MPVVVTGDDAFIAAMRRLQWRLRDNKDYFLNYGGEIVQRAIETSIVRQGLFDTGQLFNSGRTFAQTDNSILIGFGHGVVGESGSPYAWALEYGAAPHGIDATDASALFFYWEREGVWFVGPHVNHPGVKPYRYVMHGVEESMIPLAILAKNWLAEQVGK